MTACMSTIEQIKMSIQSFLCLLNCFGIVSNIVISCSTNLYKSDGIMVATCKMLFRAKKLCCIALSYAIEMG